MVKYLSRLNEIFRCSNSHMSCYPLRVLDQLHLEAVHLAKELQGIFLSNKITFYEQTTTLKNFITYIYTAHLRQKWDNGAGARKLSQFRYGAMRNSASSLTEAGVLNSRIRS